MNELQMIRDRALREDFKRLQKKVDKILSPILAQQKSGEISSWAKGEIFKEVDRTLNEAHKAINDWLET